MTLNTFSLYLHERCIPASICPPLIICLLCFEERNSGVWPPGSVSSPAIRGTSRFISPSIAGLSFNNRPNHSRGICLQLGGKLQIPVWEVHAAGNAVISCGNQMLSICVKWQLVQAQVVSLVWMLVCAWCFPKGFKTVCAPSLGKQGYGILICQQTGGGKLMSYDCLILSRSV